MKFVCISDTHNMHEFLELPEGDVLIHAGDFTNQGKPHEIVKFMKWFSEQPHKHKVLIAGNHDKMFDFQAEDAKKLIPEGVIYLNQSMVELDGIKIWGEPRTPTFGDGWGFNVDRKDSHKHWDLVPRDIDIIISHGPPAGCGDLVWDMHVEKSLIHVGCSDLAGKIKHMPNLKVVICGHIHEGYGHYRLAGTDIYNVTQVGTGRTIFNRATVFEMGSETNTYVPAKSNKPEFAALESSMLRFAMYIPESQLLVVTFAGGDIVSYSGVTRDEFDEVVKAESAGKAFNKVIRGNKDFNYLLAVRKQNG